MTRKILLIAGVAGLALTAPASGEKGGKGGGDKPEQSEAQKAEARQGGGQRAERPQHQERVQVQRDERPQTQRVERPQRVERQVERAERPQRIERQQQRVERQAERPQRIERQQQRVERRQQRVERQAERPQRIERQQARQVERAQRFERREVRQVERPQRIERQQARQAERVQQPQIQDVRGDDRRETKQARRDDRQVFRADKRVERQQRKFERRDMRPMRDLGRQRISIGERVAATAFAPVPAFYGSRYNDTPDYYHRYDDDYGTVYRVNRDSNFVSALMPMFGGYSIGDPWPSMYQSSYVPYGYQAQYYDTPDYYYRNDGYGIYQMDGSTQLITALVALLTGQNFGIGQTLPASYGAYNVPMAYRSNYYDTNDDWYRYGDGYIYQVDPNSRRIEERYPLYADNYMIGQPWPVAYPGYNVPYGYRDAYYDTPQNHYRYANNGIYQVDPTSQLITALVALVSGQQFGVGQAMPVGYSTYNVPFDYRDRYADSDDDWYRYADGYVYQVDPGSGLIEEAFPVSA